jgi:hypothetical protein
VGWAGRSGRGGVRRRTGAETTITAPEPATDEDGEQSAALTARLRVKLGSTHQSVAHTLPGSLVLAALLVAAAGSTVVEGHREATRSAVHTAGAT